MATWIGNLNLTAQTQANTLPKGTSSYGVDTSEFFFYSNNPEQVKSSGIADGTNKYYLNAGRVSGNGQIYTWHINKHTGSLKTNLIFHNPNSFPIVVRATNYGQTKNSATVNDLTAWKSYYDGASKSITIPAGGYGNLFDEVTVNVERVWGIVARISITNSNSGAKAAAQIWDVAWTGNNSGNATLPSVPEASSTLRVRGIGSGYYYRLNFAQIAADTSAGGKGYLFGSTRYGVFGGQVCTSVISPGNGGGGRVEGGFGQQYLIKLPIKNSTDSFSTFDVIIGSHGGPYQPFVNWQNYYFNTGKTLAAWKYQPIIRTANLAPNGTETVEFSAVLPAGSNAPLFVGVKKT